MKIIDVKARVFLHTTRRHQEAAGHAHPGEPHKVKQALLTITCDDGWEGHCFGVPEVIRPHVIDKFVKTVLVGQDPFDRERLWQELAHWQRGSAAQLTDRTLAVVDTALWDLAGRALGVPVHKLIGAYRDKVPAYGSTMCGDELEGGLAAPEDYGRFAEKLVKRGYKGIKLHTWMPPVSCAPFVKMDQNACAAVRDYERAFALKMTLLEPLHRAFVERAGTDRRRAYEQWCAEREPELTDFATYMAIAREHGPDWREWPMQLRNPRSPAVATTSTTRCPSAASIAMVPAVSRASSSGWAWKNTAVRGGTRPD
jgi:L-alanine-DL-glutamate epimerase-like enolase superfamily enzyme